MLDSVKRIVYFEDRGSLLNWEIKELQKLFNYDLVCFV